ncbi:MAG: class I SAM-dependent methyltransferase [Opitutaceae bacterium]|nr:class I SAM-dependent methyltransferase [Opitutaceae bacterium]
MKFPESDRNPENAARDFYDRQYLGVEYSNRDQAECHGMMPIVSDFVVGYQLKGRKVLEVGCGRGAFQDLVEDYTGTDLSSTVAKYFRKKFVACDATRMPFKDHTFDAIWSIWVLEHTPDPEAVLNEMRRVIRPGGYLLLRPAWHCRWWNCHGINVRPWCKLPWRYWPAKLLLPLLEARWFRGLMVIPRRIWLTALTKFSGRSRLWWKKLPGDFATFWCSDSDAVAYLDPVAVCLWFESHGDRILSVPSGWRRLFLGAPALVIQRGDR